MRSRLIVFCLAAICAAFFGGAVAMAQDTVIASAIEGRLVDASGQPAAGVTITRKWEWGGRSDTVSVTTDAAGRFAFPPQEPTKRIGFLRRQMNTSIFVTLTAETNQGPVILADYLKVSYTPNSESPGEVPLYFECSTDGDPSGSFPFGTCRLVGSPPG